LIEKYSKRSQEKREAIARFIEQKGQEPSNDQVSVLVRETRDDDLREIPAEVRKFQRDHSEVIVAGFPDQHRHLIVARLLPFVQ